MLHADECLEICFYEIVNSGECSLLYIKQTLCDPKLAPLLTVYSTVVILKLRSPLLMCEAVGEVDHEAPLRFEVVAQRD